MTYGAGSNVMIFGFLVPRAFPSIDMNDFEAIIFEHLAYNILKFSDSLLAM